jgi:hypothetical protein
MSIEFICGIAVWNCARNAALFTLDSSNSFGLKWDNAEVWESTNDDDLGGDSFFLNFKLQYHK